MTLQKNMQSILSTPNLSSQYHVTAWEICLAFQLPMPNWHSVHGPQFSSISRPGNLQYMQRPDFTKSLKRALAIDKVELSRFWGTIGKKTVRIFETLKKPLVFLIVRPPINPSEAFPASRLSFDLLLSLSQIPLAKLTFSLVRKL